MCKIVQSKIWSCLVHLYQLNSTLKTHFLFPFSSCAFVACRWRQPQTWGRGSGSWCPAASPEGTRSSPDCSSSPGPLTWTSKEFNRLNFFSQPQSNKSDSDVNETQCRIDRLVLTHLEAPLVHARRPCMVVSVLAVVGVALLVIFMAWRWRSSVTFGWRRHFGV